MAPGAVEVGVFPIFMIFARLPEPSGASEGRESRSHLGLETGVYETLGLVSVSCEISNHVQSRSRSRFL